MGNVYTDKKTGLRIMEVEYGWGMELNAIEVSVDVATKWLIIAKTAALKGSNWMNSKLNVPMVQKVISHCQNVLENAQNGESTYILSYEYIELIDGVRNIQKALIKDRKEIKEFID